MTFSLQNTLEKYFLKRSTRTYFEKGCRHSTYHIPVWKHKKWTLETQHSVPWQACLWRVFSREDKLHAAPFGFFMDMLPSECHNGIDLFPSASSVGCKSPLRSCLQIICSHGLTILGITISKQCMPNPINDPKRKETEAEPLSSS